MEAIIKGASNDVHTFDPMRGLMIRRGVPNGPTVADKRRALGTPLRTSRPRIGLKLWLPLLAALMMASRFIVRSKPT